MLKRISRPRAMITTPQVTPRMTVKRLRFRSATPEELRPGAHAAAEHVGQTAATSLVQQDEQGQQEAGDAQQHLQNDMKNVHDGLSEDGDCGGQQLCPD